MKVKACMVDFYDVADVFPDAPDDLDDLEDVLSWQGIDAELGSFLVTEECEVVQLVDIFYTKDGYDLALCANANGDLDFWSSNATLRKLV